MKSVISKTGKKVKFELSAKPGSQVFVAGTFNNWSPSTHRLKDNPATGQFNGAVHVPKGIHQYKFIVDGVWTGDPKCATVVANGYGSHNSVLHIE
jgi:5'-AMP-activated protein kinase regulatory beta subunit